MLLLLPLLAVAAVVPQLRAQECLTNGGPNPGKPCKFPFTFQGVVYNGCPPDLVFPEKNWCSTKTDSAGNHVTGEDEYGFCSPNCPTFRDGSQINSASSCKTVSGPKPNVDCVFPFEYNGIVYDGCPVDLEDPSKRWCSTKTVNGQHVTGQGEFGHCGPDCPIYNDEKDLPEGPVADTCKGSEKCKAFVQCSSQLNQNQIAAKLCRLEGGSTGVCCGDVLSVRTNAILPDPKLSLRNALDFGSLSDAVVQRAVDVGESFFNNVTSFSGLRPTLTNTRSAEFQHAIFQQQSPGLASVQKLSLSAMRAAKELRTALGVRSDDLSGGISFTGADTTNTILSRQCPAAPACDPRAKYRQIEGGCNNLREPKFGMSFTPLQRVVPNAYADGLERPRIAKSGNNLPSTRVITNGAIGNVMNEDPRFSAMLVAFGQFLDHDLDHVPISRNQDNQPIECCSEDDSFFDTTNLSEEEAALCLPIRIPDEDPFFRGRKGCINFVRSVTAPTLRCQPGPLEQVNQITHWLDSSNVYGSLNSVARSVRSFRDGLLRTEPCKDGTECLPFANVSNCLGPSTKCALAGDLRVNEQPTLGAMHQLFLREHNRIARELIKFNPGWNDETLYQEAKRILNAEWQHIIYNEYLPVLLGNTFLREFGLQPLTQGFSNAYRNDFDPSVTNAFAAAAFRIGHTLITTVIKTYRSVGTTLSGSLDLKTVFNNADLLRDNNMFDEILKGLAIQNVETVDNNFSDDVTNSLFDDGDLGIDLIAINMQRGRDHGLPGYVQYREVCGQGTANSFEDLSSNISPDRIQRLKNIYAHVEDIDLFIGMTMEQPCREDSLVSCTFLCLIGDVFARARYGDRFFYDNPNQPGSFTESQLTQIRKASLARIICDNTKVEQITPMVFRALHPTTNPLTACRSRLFLTGIPQVDLSVFTG